MKLGVIEAYVTEVVTRVSSDDGLRVADLPAKSHERLFLERVPLDREQLAKLSFKDPETGFAELAETVEAWGFRLIQGLGEPRSRREIAQSWFFDEYLPVLEDLREADLIEGSNQTDAYFRVTCDRYMLLRTHDWDESVIERLKARR